MNLVLFIGNDLIESLSLDVTKITFPGYVGSLKRELEQKHVELISQAVDKPEFLIFEVEQ